VPGDAQHGSRACKGSLPRWSPGAGRETRGSPGGRGRSCGAFTSRKWGQGLLAALTAARREPELAGLTMCGASNPARLAFVANPRPDTPLQPGAAAACGIRRNRPAWGSAVPRGPR
jgi:hypothetical protein